MEFLAAFHIHSKWSYDGSWSLEDLAAKFRSRGSRILMMTEHDRGFSTSRLDQYREMCARASSRDFLVLPGVEYSDAANRVHILVWGPVPFIGEGLPTGETLSAVRAAGGLAVLAHPSRRDAWRYFDPSWADRLLGIEVWNRKYDGWAPSQTAPSLVRDSGALPFAGLDFHTQRQSFPLEMVLELEEPISEESVLNCLRARRCQARAFGLLFNQSLVRTALPVLKVAELSRRRAASIARSARGSQRS